MLIPATPVLTSTPMQPCPPRGQAGEGGLIDQWLLLMGEAPADRPTRDADDLPAADPQAALQLLAPVPPLPEACPAPAQTEGSGEDRTAFKASPDTAAWIDMPKDGFPANEAEETVSKPPTAVAAPEVAAEAPGVDADPQAIVTDETDEWPPQRIARGQESVVVSIEPGRPRPAIQIGPLEMAVRLSMQPKAEADPRETVAEVRADDAVTDDTCPTEERTAVGPTKLIVEAPTEAPADSGSTEAADTQHLLGETVGAGGRVIEPGLGPSRETSGYAPPPAPVQQVQKSLAELIAHRREGVLELAMSPEELGHVRIGLETDGDSVRVSIAAERGETLDLLRRHGEQLLADLRAAGYASAQLNCSVWDRSGGAASRHPPTRPSGAAAVPADQENLPTHIARPPHHGGLDMRL